MPPGSADHVVDVADNQGYTIEMWVIDGLSCRRLEHIQFATSLVHVERLNCNRGAADESECHRHKYGVKV